MSERSYLAVDLGASSGRAVLGTLGDEKLTVREVNRFSHAPVPLGGFLSWNLPSLWSGVLDSLRVCRKLGHTSLGGVAADTWGVDFGLIDRDGGILANPLCYRDASTEGMEARIRATLGDDEFYAETGMTIARVGTLPELMALRDRRPSLLDAAATLLWMPDLFRYLLCGEKSTEPTIIGSSLLSSIDTGGFSQRILDAFGISRSLLPPLARAGTSAGRLLPELGGETGIGDAAVSVVAGHDTLSAAVAAPYLDASTLFVSAGTWSVVGVERDTPLLLPEARRKGFVSELGANGSIFARNLLGFYLIERVRQQWRADGMAADWPDLMALAEAAGPFSVTLDLEDEAFFAPGDPEASLRSFLRKTGQDAGAGAGTLVRAYLEGLALMYRRVVDDLEALAGLVVKRICLVGGGCRNPPYCQAVASATGREVLAGPVEATAAGNIGLQCVADGTLVSTREVRDLVRRSFPPVSYEPRDRQLWEDAYGRYRKLVARRNA